MASAPHFSPAFPLALIALLSACDSKAKSAQPAPGGLVFALTILQKGVPQPGAILIATPGEDLAGTWKTELHQMPSKPVTKAIGRASDGAIYQADLDAQGNPSGQPFRWARSAQGWEQQAVEGLTLEQLDFLDAKGAVETFSYELGHGNVINKALWFTPKTGAPGILTISGNMGCLDLWRPEGKVWSAKTLWAEPVGSKNHRLRDMEIADFDGDGEVEIAIATHDLGAIYVVKETPQGFVGTRIAAHPEMAFVHEIEVGDVDGDGLSEIFATPSEPNRLDGTHQRGEIHRYDFENGSYRMTVVENSPTTHAKEILCVDLEGDGQLELYAVMEGEALKDLKAIDNAGQGTHIKRYDFVGSEIKAQPLLDLPGNLCRFLVAADLEGDGRRELIASTMSDGIFSIGLQAGQWTSKRLLGGLASGGFEHCTLACDWDGDGADELYVGSDEYKRLNRLAFDKKLARVTKTVMADMTSLGGYISWNIGVLPANFAAAQPAK